MYKAAYNFLIIYSIVEELLYWSERSSRPDVYFTRQKPRNVLSQMFKLIKKQ